MSSKLSKRGQESSEGAQGRIGLLAPRAGCHCLSRVYTVNKTSFRRGLLKIEFDGSEESVIAAWDLVQKEVFIKVDVSFSKRNLLQDVIYNYVGYPVTL